MRYILCCGIILCLFHIHIASASFSLQFKLDYYKTNARLSTGLCCDDKKPIANTCLFPNYCNKTFSICLSSTVGQCNLINVTTDVYNSAFRDITNFGNSLNGGISHPIEVTGSKWPSQGVHVTVTVNDLKPLSTSRLMDFFFDNSSFVIPVEKLTSNSSTFDTIQLNGSIFGQNEKLTISHLIRCEPDFYGISCDVSCVGQDSDEAHLVCNSNGEKVCKSGWTGLSSNCVIPDFCFNSPCNNGGICDFVNGRFKCNCPETVDATPGPRCDNSLSFCNHSSNPCSNGGQCVDNESSYYCVCPRGQRYGDHCEYRDPCADQPCYNGGECQRIEKATESSSRLLTEEFKCLCNKPFYGERCSSVDYCLLEDACFNDGICINGTNYNNVNSNQSWWCQCPEEYIGDRCEWNKTTTTETTPVEDSTTITIEPAPQSTTDPFTEITTSDLLTEETTTENLQETTEFITTTEVSTTVSNSEIVTTETIPVTESPTSGHLWVVVGYLSNEKEIKLIQLVKNKAAEKNATADVTFQPYTINGNPVTYVKVLIKVNGTHVDSQRSAEILGNGDYRWLTDNLNIEFYYSNSQKSESIEWKTILVAVFGSIGGIILIGSVLILYVLISRKIARRRLEKVAMSHETTVVWYKPGSTLPLINNVTYDHHPVEENEYDRASEVYEDIYETADL